MAEAPDLSAAGTPVPASPPRPGTLGGRWPPFLNVALFVLTFGSAFAAGLFLDEATDPIVAGGRALAFSCTLLCILLAHEMGHFLLARRHRVDATWPFFIPAPLLSLIGTLGAVIRLRQMPRTRRALVDIGATGPLAGFAATLPVLAAGLRLSTFAEGPASPAARFTLADALRGWLVAGHFPQLREGVELGEPLAMQLLERWILGAAPTGSTLVLHPVAIAGWFGLLLTALNLLPLGQLDGGHLLFAASPPLHRKLGPPISALLLALGVFTPFTGWAFWGLLTGTWLSRHPALAAPEPSLGRGRAGLVVVSALVFLLSFTPMPIAMLLR